jgi:CHAD domain-containing protein
VIPSQLIGPFHERVDAFARELPGVGQGSVEAVHRARVASRRLREVLPLLTLDRPTALKIKRRLCEVTRRLGDVRELDVLALLIEELRRSTRYRSAGLDRVEAVVARARVATRDQLPDTLSQAMLRRLTDRLERVTGPAAKGDVTAARQVAGRPKRTWLWALEARLSQRSARVRSAVDLAGTIYAADRLHDVRIAVKKLRYVSELLHEAGRKDLASSLATLKAAQDLLGRLHDFEVLMTWGREAQSQSSEDPEARRELGLLLLGLEDDCRRMHARYMHVRKTFIAIANRSGPNTPPEVSARRRQRANASRATRTRGGR